mmetsp:Transcript_41542/g.100007  ORF Transcript_41542/g.100007 Transcript_41542/m.100007 type:complete len:923 (-) Transcript_41542:1031-3799(-)|eukprot:CAMPEP_0113613600 /NCGR_PEP_ID=MMETSP0017_2-20120614/6724_1 /TAXON_ID=2856 /ORGANISM="Cylindrotheca closterium" /LENGTH=922 /DNA_ID=CAMNT_0000522721 /DNA_START=11 /DNA_END=2779 /DNA_ORIENTATION=+ /assembly_acc=CAM_ASM_000147
MSVLFDRMLQDLNDTLVGNETLTNVTIGINSTAPTGFPTIDPSDVPSSVPSLSLVPSVAPSLMPSLFPTGVPSETPSVLPTTEEQGLVGGHQDDALANSLRIYGSLFVVIMILFCCLRKKYPRAYCVRGWVDGLRTPLADEQYGFFDWMWKLNSIEEQVLMDECGMDALCFVRVLDFGFKVASVGVLNSIWLMLVYKTADKTPETEFIQSAVVSLSTANLPPGSPRLLATVIAAYLIFGYTMYAILKEFEWFIAFRHKFLSKRLARNYAVYVQNIPIEYQTNAALTEFFSDAYPGTVIEAHLAMKAPTLKKKVAEREGVISNLEHAINIREVTGEIPQAKNLLTRQPEGSAIDAYGKELVTLNKEISETIDTLIEEFNNVQAMDVDDGSILGSSLGGSFREGGPNSPQSTGAFAFAKKSVKGVTSIATNAVKDVGGAVKDVGGAAINVAGSGANLAKSLISAEDGEALTAGFVTFNSLRAAHGALQMIQYNQPHKMEVREAPQPEDVIWPNIGKEAKQVQIGKLISFAATMALCLFWTIPMSFISTLSSIEGLKDQFEWVGTLIENQPWVEGFLAQLAPLLVVVAKEVLKIILETFSKQEGPISGAVVEASLFSKLAWFLIIQTFFVQAISGSIVSEISNMFRRPELIIDLLATSLPRRGIYFIQVVLVDTVISLATELLRVSAVAQAIIRSKVGPDLTEKERNTSFLGVRPLADPLKFYHAQNLSNCVLYFVVFFVYATIAPIASFFVGICFFFKAAAYRHQFVYIYPTFPDSGGHLWANFFKLLPWCMTIGQIVLQGMLGLKKQPIANALMLPLTIATILFQIFVKQQHFLMTQYLPTREAIGADHRYSNNEDFSFVEGKFVQPELREREKFPDNGNEEDIRAFTAKDEENMDDKKVEDENAVEENVEDENLDDTLKKAN